MVAKEPFKMATDETVSESVRLPAIKYVLDRIGLGARTVANVDLNVSGWKHVFESVAQTVEIPSRTAYCAKVPRSRSRR